MSDDKARYAAAMHAVQSGVMLEHELGSNDAQPKHLRTGICSCMVTDAAIARLLIARGIFTEAEYARAVAEEAEAEQARYEARLGVRLG